MTTRLLLLMCALAFCLAPVLALAQAAPAVDRDTACGQPATGYRADGSKTPTPVTLDAEGARLLRVGPDGYWRWCDLPDPAAKPAPQPCIGSYSTRVWGTGAAQCTGGPDRTIAHGQAELWQQWQGAMRGMLIEACTDGVRRVVASTCAAATECDTLREITRDGVTYRYDARPQHRRVPLGATVQAVAADGSTWPLQCIAGEWHVGPAPRAADVAASAAPAPRAGGCASQTWAARQGLRLVYWRYAGPRVAVGDVVSIDSAPPGTTAQAVCLASGRLEVR